MPDAERQRLADADAGRAPWRRWGPYLSERAWGTVREDYSADGDAWASFPHDHARSRAYRWNEDGLAGVCDERQLLCLALAFWNGRDPILKERIFGLGGPEGNHGEDAKELWWYVDCTPTHSWMRWRYLYPQAEFPYDLLVTGNRARDRTQPELELLDTGVLDGGYWDITADYAKASPEDLLLRVSVRNAGPDPAVLDVLPTLWFRNTWSWGSDAARPSIRLGDGALVAEHPVLGTRSLTFGGSPEALFCDNETNTARLFGVPSATVYPKDGIGDHVVHGAATVRPERWGTKAALRHRLEVAPGETATIALRLAPGEGGGLGDDFGRVMTARRAEADAFHAALVPAGASADEAVVLRQALAGMLWGKQHYRYDVRRWLDGDPASAAPPASRLSGRNAGWAHLHAADVISMPDKWEYPWFAAWDLAFHCIALAHVDATFAKGQLLLLCREWYMHPNGQLPAYEWSFGDVNPPVQALAALHVFAIDGARDTDFLERVFHKLLLNFTWWVNRRDAAGDDLFEGGFLGLDNIGLFNRSDPSVPGLLEESDGTAWMAMFCLHMLEIALTLAERDPTYEDMATKFLEHFALIARALNARGLWSEQEGLYLDVLRLGDGSVVPLPVRSVVGLLPMAATMVLEASTVAALPEFAARLEWFEANRPDGEGGEAVRRDGGPGSPVRRCFTMVGEERLRRLLGPLLDPGEFLSDHGLRALSKRHAEHPVEVTVEGVTARLDYEPGESTTPMFGGNSNWRGPVWMPVNHLLISALRVHHRFLGDAFRVECPTGSGRLRTLAEVADELTGRVVGLFLRGPDGRRPVLGERRLLQEDPALSDLMPFNEYFHGETGEGLGASHQTGWTGLVADLILHRSR